MAEVKDFYVITRYNRSGNYHELARGNCVPKSGRSVRPK